GQWSPCCAVVGSLVGVWLHVAEGVAIKCGVSRAFIERTCFDAGDPGVFGQAGNFIDYVGPGLAAVARDLNISIISTHPDEPAIFWRLADGIDGGMHLCRGIVHGDTAGLFLLLFFRIVGGQVGRDALPGLAMIARAVEELRSDVDCPFFVGTYVDWGVP